MLDDQIFALQRFGGISAYWLELKAGLAASNASYDLIDSKPILRIQPARAPGTVFHSSYYRFATGDESRTVTTVHDLIPERRLARSLTSRIFVAYRRVLFRLSDAFICVSEQTKTDLLSRYPKECAHKPVYVAHHGNPRSSFIDWGGPLPEPAAPEARRRTFLFVGNRDGYKSFDVAIDALRFPSSGAKVSSCCARGRLFLPMSKRCSESAEWNLTCVGQVGSMLAACSNYMPSLLHCSIHPPMRGSACQSSRR